MKQNCLFCHLLYNLKEFHLFIFRENLHKEWRTQLNISNPDPVGTEDSVLISELS